MKKVGRNDPCPCSSGKKYKKCCLNKTVSQRKPIIPISPEIIKQFQKHQKKESERISKFGKVRPDIGISFKGYKFLAVGSKLFHSQKWKHYLDFLLEYLPTVFGKEWGQAELAKPFEEQHQIAQWRKKAYEFMKKHNGTQGVIPNGFLAAYSVLAYDLYIVESNGRLDDELLSRLKHRAQFQGARHELFAEATCLRAGYVIEHENEKDKSKRHVEFTATHKSTKQKISVEAKSKHRAGILGFPGKPQSEKELNLRFGNLINDAIRKNPPHPLVIFLDTNLPTTIANRIYRPESINPTIPPKLFMKLLDRIRKEHEEKDPYNLIVFTNHAYSYAKEDEVDPKKDMLSVISQIPIKPPTNFQAIIDLCEAADKYGNIPQDLPS
ncbi:MAG: SEC-C metal-binding domain-containing protein [bacterium]